MLRLDQCRLDLEKRKGEVQGRLTGVFTPLKVAKWDHMLAQCPDKQYVAYLLSSIQESFWIRYERREHVLRSVRKNMKTAVENPQVIREYLDVERKRGVLLGPVEWPKSHQPGKWRLIVDLSHLEGRSANDGISGELCPLRHMHMEEAVRRLLKLGPGAQMAKMDTKVCIKLDGASASTGSFSAGCAVRGAGVCICSTAPPAFDPHQKFSMRCRWSRMDCKGTWSGAFYHSWCSKF